MPAPSPWPEAELDIIRRHYPRYASIQALLPHRSLSELYRQAHKMGLPHTDKASRRPPKKPRYPKLKPADARRMATEPGWTPDGWDRRAARRRLTAMGLTAARDYSLTPPPHKPPTMTPLQEQRCLAEPGWLPDGVTRRQAGDHFRRRGLKLPPGERTGRILPVGSLLTPDQMQRCLSEPGWLPDGITRRQAYNALLHKGHKLPRLRPTLRPKPQPTGRYVPAPHVLATASPRASGYDLMRLLIHHAPRRIDEVWRMELVSEVALGILEGRYDQDQLPLAFARAARVLGRQLHPYLEVSLDAPVRGGTTLAETLVLEDRSHADANPWL